MKEFKNTSFAANDFGLNDMHGNISEWVEDCWHDNYRGAPSDGTAWTTKTCKFRVSRGGDWTSDPVELRSAMRYVGEFGIYTSDLGFRVARALVEGK